MSEWQECRISDLVDIDADTYSPKEKWPFVNYLDTGSVTENNIEQIQHLDPKVEKIPSRARRKAKVGSIVYSTVRPNQRHYALIKEVPENFLVSTGFAVLDVKPDVADERFVFSFLTQIDVVNQLQSIAEQGVCTYPALNPSDIGNLTLRVPDLTTQRRIAAVLGALDDKIELNRKMNANLEAMAQALFKSWFVDFEPFGGQMPEGWKNTPLTELADFASGYSYNSNELRDSQCAMATIKNFERGGGFKLDGYKEIVPSEKLKESQKVELFDILVAHTDLTQNAEVVGNAEMILSKAGYESLIMSSDLVKVIPKEGVSRYILAGVLKYVGFKGHALGYVNGTTVLHMSKKALPEFELPYPSDPSQLQTLAECAETIYKRIVLNHESIRTLAQLRDTLLPKLMSGELNVDDVKID